MVVHLEYLIAAFRSRTPSDRGASLTEYALLIALLAVVCIAALTALGGAASSNFSSLSTAL